MVAQSIYQRSIDAASLPVVVIENFSIDIVVVSAATAVFAAAELSTSIVLG